MSETEVAHREATTGTAPPIVALNFKRIDKGMLIGLADLFASKATRNGSACLPASGLQKTVNGSSRRSANSAVTATPEATPKFAIEGIKKIAGNVS